MIQPVLDHLTADQPLALARLIDWLTIPSISTDPAAGPDLKRSGQWVVDRLTELGLDAHLMPTGGHPAVVARTTDAHVLHPDAPRILFYGHHDVQPADPVDRWTSPPFEPAIRPAACADEGDAIYARGALDDKGQAATFLEACRAWHQTHGKLPVPITFLIEGEEEIGSPNLPRFLTDHQDLLAADIAVISDTGAWETAGTVTPAITCGLRGLVYFDLQLHGPTRDLHSGMFGGAVANPATILVRVLGQLFDQHNRITIPGFYDHVAPITDAERAQWARLNFDETAFLAGVGGTAFGEAGHDTLARRWARPSCDINGLYGGYMGDGAKTVLPSYAGAKISFRIPANMNPHKVARQFTDWLHTRDVGGCRWQITNHGEASPVATATDSPYVKAAASAITAATGRQAALIREGATIPVGADLKTILGIDTLFIGFGRETDQIHAPDEHFALTRFHLGTRVHAHLLHHLATVPR